MSAVISGIGIYYPDQVLSNVDLEKIVDTSDEWIKTRTGIKQRYIVPKNSNITASDMGKEACLKAIKESNLNIDDIDGIINSSICPDAVFPATACFIQKKIGIKKAFAFDITAACAGFVYGLNLAHLMIENGQARNILVVGSELLSRTVDWKDRNTCILFGDAAGAVVVSHSNDKNRGMLGSILKSKGEDSEILYLSNPLMMKKKCFIEMEGQSVFKLAVSSLTDILKETLQKYELSISDLKFVAFHQANIRILDAVAKKLGLTSEQLIINVDKYGNTSSASIPIVLEEAQKKSLFSQGDLVATVGIGGGMSWGCNLMKW